MIDRASKTIWALGLSLSVASFAACSGAPLSEAGSDETVSVSEAQALTGTLFIVGSIKDTSAAHAVVPGVAVTLTLPDGTSRISNANSNGVYRFSNLAAGTYTVKAAKAGASFSPASSTFTLSSASTESSFSCVSGCEGAAAVVPLHELVIVDPSVTNDARASNASTGRWSFRFLMEQMTPAGTDPSDFVLNWIQGFKAAAGPINGFPVQERSVDTGLVAGWPKLSNGKLDLGQAPFKLLAIVNRTDLHEIGDGEGRFIYGMNTGGFGQSFTVIFEYRLPTVDAATNAPLTRLSWINQFHALGPVPFGATFNSNLQAITDKFVTAGKVPANPNGNAISQVRTNEIQFGSPWQLREFHLVKNAAGQGFLKLSPAAQTPDASLNNSASVANYITTNRFHIIGGLATVTNSLIGGQSDENAPATTWAFPSFPAIDEQMRHAFAGQTCNGCHNGETTQIDGFYHISPRLAPGADGTGIVSDFIKNNEFPRRRRFMQNRLVCKADLSDCSPGGDPML